MDWRSDEANYGFLHHELTGQYRRALAALRGTHTLSGATTAFERGYERAGVKAMADRMAYGRRALREVNLLGAARRAGLEGGGGKVTGEASLNINLQGFPKGTRTKTAMGGELFKSVKVDRGRAAPWTNQEA